ncbi:MAG: DUF4388 domain-containing protein [Deltaproteobacteria bacterium]|nr:DUF4388 domain-containing protein [Deltaproteobacteria bacterium]
MRFKILKDNIDRIILPDSVSKLFSTFNEKGEAEFTRINQETFILHSSERPLKSMFMGDISVLGLVEIIGMINSLRKDGVLTFIKDNFKKALYFQGGELVYAISELEEDRLGNILFRSGRISRETLLEVADKVKSGTRLGEILMERKLVTPRDIYVGLTQQVKAIFLSLFSYQDGFYVFEEKKPDLTNAVKLSESTLELIMEGMRQYGELSRLRSIISDGESILSQISPSPDIELTEKEKYILTFVDSRRTVNQIIEESRLGEYDCMRFLVSLYRAGFVKIIGTKSEEANKYRDYINKVKKALEISYKALEGKGRFGTLHIESYISQPPDGDEIISLCQFDIDGNISNLSELYNKAKELYFEMAERELLHSLSNLLNYCIFEVKNGLPESERDDILREIAKLYEGVRNGGILI